MDGIAKPSPMPIGIDMIPKDVAITLYSKVSHDRQIILPLPWETIKQLLSVVH